MIRMSVDDFALAMQDFEVDATFRERRLEANAARAERARLLEALRKGRGTRASRGAASRASRNALRQCKRDCARKTRDCQRAYRDNEQECYKRVRGSSAAGSATRRCEEMRREHEKECGLQGRQCEANC